MDAPLQPAPSTAWVGTVCVSCHSALSTAGLGAHLLSLM